MNRTNKKGTTFDDVLVLYNFDDALRDLVFKYIRIIEQEIAFNKSLSALIAKTDKSSPILSEKILLDSMGFPPNWKMITRYKK